MEEHHFNKNVAKLVGVNAAIIFNNIQHWCDHNKTNNKNFYDGEYWTYNSLNAFNEQFPYMSKKQIMSALDKLKDNGFIDYGEYNTNPYDRTRWYCDLTRKRGLNVFLSMVQKGNIDVPKRVHVDGDKRYTSITDNKPYRKHLNINRDFEKSLPDENESKGEKEEDTTITLFGEVKTPVNKKSRARAEKKETHPAVNMIKKYWFEEFRTTDKPASSRQWATVMLKIGGIVEHILEYAKTEFDRDISPDEVLDVFKQVTIACSKSNSVFYQTIDLLNLHSKFSSALTLTQIQIKNNGKQSNNYEKQFAFGIYQRSSSSDSVNNSQ